MTALEELKKRKIVQWGLAYLAGAWVALQLVAILAGQFGWPGWTQRAATIVLGCGLFVALVLAWYHGEKGRQRVSGPELLMLAALLVVAGSAVALVRGRADLSAPTDGGSGSSGLAASSDSSAPPGVPPATDPDGASRRAIAVLPFENLSGESSDEYFSDGITEDILTALAKIGDLHVISRTSSMTYRDTDKTVGEIGRELGVGTVLEGSVQRYGDRVRVTAQLIDARTDRHLWAERYDRQFRDLFAIQSEIATAIAGALQAQLTETERQRLLAGGTGDLDAYELYLRGREIVREEGGREATERAIAHFRRALELDPDYALAHAGLARAYAARQQYRGVAWGDSALLSAARAIRHAPRAAEGYMAMADAQVWWGLYDLAVENLELALERNPNHADALREMAIVAEGRGQLDESLAWMLRVLALEPTYAPHYDHIGELLDWLGADAAALRWYNRSLEEARFGFPAYESLAYHHLDEGRVDRAETHVEEMRELAPEAAPTLLAAGFVAIRRGDLEAALDWMQRWYETRSPEWEPGELLGWLHARLGEPEKAAPYLRRTEDYARQWIGRGDEGVWPFRMLAVVQVARGDNDGAIRSLERAVERGGFRAWPVHSYRTYPPFDPLRGDPRFEALMERLGGRLERMREAAGADSVMPPPTEPEVAQVPGS